MGTTSAYAENTHDQYQETETTRNYLRVRGEYGASLTRCQPVSELPPRTRRILAGAQLLRKG